MQLTCTFDTRNLNRAQMILLRHSKRSPARCINSTAYHVIKDVVEAGGGFPVVTQGRIDTDMNVITSPKILDSGKLSRSETSLTFLNRTPTAKDVSAINTAERIVLARMHPTSRFSLSTGNRWPAIPPDFGRGRGAGAGTDRITLFWKWVRETAERMVRARHSSTGFLKKSWIDLKVSLLPFALGKADAPGVVVTQYSEVKPAKEGNAVAVCAVSNMLGVGMRTTKELSEKYNEANHQIGGRRLQAAIDREFEAKMKIAASREWAKDEPELRLLGMMVKP